MERDEDRRRDLAGHVKSEDVEVSKTILVNGVPFEQLVERNGQPPVPVREWARRQLNSQQLQRRNLKSWGI